MNDKKRANYIALFFSLARFVARVTFIFSAFCFPDALIWLRWRVRIRWRVGIGLNRIRGRLRLTATFAFTAIIK